MPRKLRNIRLSEISLVDAAANRRKFYFIKSDATPVTTDDIGRVMKTLLGADPPDHFIKNVESLEEGTRTGFAGLLAVAEEYADALPEAMCKSFAQMSMAAIEPCDETTDIDKATAQKTAALRASGNTLIKELEVLLEKTRKAGGNIRFYAQSLVTLDEFVGVLKWLVNTTDDTNQPDMPERTGLGTEFPIGKRARKYFCEVKKDNKLRRVAIKFRCPECKTSGMDIAVSKRAGESGLVARCPGCKHIMMVKRSVLKRKMLAAFDSVTE